MTSKRLGIIVLALAVVWSLAGLDWFAPAASYAPRSMLSVGTAQAGFEDFLTGYSTCSLEGDPDQYANGMEGDPDEYAGSSGADSTDTDPEAPEDESAKPSKIGSLTKTLMSLAGMVYDSMAGFRY